MVRIFFIFLFFFSCAAGCAQKSKDSITWHNASEIAALLTIEVKPVLVDIYTDWCLYCHIMDSTTYRDDSVIQLLNKHFYCMRLDAEGKDSIIWMGQLYPYIPKYNLQELVIKLTDGNIVYPSTILFDPANKVKNIQSGYLEKGQFLTFLRGFVHDF